MLDKINEVWIIQNSGICLFNQSAENSVNEILFSGFLSGIRTFLEEIGEKKLEKLELGNSKLIFYNLDEYHLFIVLKSSKKAKDKFLEKKINEVQQKFINRFSPLLIDHHKKNIPYNNEDFQDFHDDLLEILEEGIEKNMNDWFNSL